MEKILIIQTAFIGDVILATPLIENINKNYPKAQIDFLLKKGNENILLNHPKLNNVILFDKTEKIKSIFKLLKQIRTEKYCMVINLHRYFSSGVLTSFSRAKKKYGFKKNPLSFLFTKSFVHKIGDGTHETDRNLSLIEPFCTNLINKPKLYPTKEDFEKVLYLKNETYYCFAPSSVWFTKQAPKSIWIKKIQEIIDLDTSIYLIGGKEDYKFCEEILIELNGKKIVNLAGKLSLLESAALLKDAKRTFVNDSGPLHIASSVNAPVTAYFCSTIPDFGFWPLSDDSKIIEVLNLSCRPCGLHGHQSCPKGHFKCGKNLV
jgi:ADP-heptose:LPS heptosyltransferase